MTITPESTSLHLTMTTVAVSLEVSRFSGGGFHFTIRNPLAIATYVADATEITAWLEDEDLRHEGTRMFPDPATAHTVLHVRKRFHSMTLEELVEITVVNRGEQTGGMIILNYPQTRELAAFLQS